MKCFIRMYVSFTIVLIACIMGCAQNTSDSRKETDAMIKKLLEGESVEEQIETLKQKAKESLDAGDHKKAAEYLIKAGQLAASDDRDSGQLGRSLILQGKFEEAKEQCQKAYNRDPLNFTFAVNLGHSYLLTGDATAARTYYEKAFSLIMSEDEFDAVLEDFRLFIENGWQVEACRRESAWMTEAFDTLYQFHLEANRYWAQAARALRKKGQELEVIQLWEKGIEAEQASPKPRLDVLVFRFNLLGDYYTGVLGQHLKALENYKQALELNRKLDLELNRKLAQEELILSKIGKVYNALGEYPKALEYFEQALELSHTLTRENYLGAKYQYCGQF